MSQGSGHPPRGLGEVTPMPVEAAHSKVLSNTQRQQEGTEAASSQAFPPEAQLRYFLSLLFSFFQS